MAMTACAAKLCDQLDLLLAERPDLLAVDADGADQLVFLEHRHAHKGSGASKFDEQWGSRGLGREVGNLHRLLGRSATAKVCSGAVADHGMAPPLLGVCGRRIVHRDGAETRVPFAKRQRAEVGPQSRTAFASTAWKTGSNSPGELDITCSTSEDAVCCSSASLSFFSRSRACALSFVTSEDWD